jgi:hypothetical protein
MSLDTCLSLLNLAGDLCAGMRPLNLPSLCASAMGMMVEPCPLAYVQAPTLPMPQYLPSTPPLLTVREPNAPEAANSYACGVGGSYDCGAARTTVQACEPIGYEAIKHANIPNFRISAKPSSQKLEMKVGDHACLNCVKMSVKIGDNEIKLTRFDDRVRVRGEELKATADCIRSEEKDCLILEGDVVLHYKKDGHSANVTGDCIEMNLSSGAVTIKPAAKVSSCPSVRINRVEGYYSK